MSVEGLGVPLDIHGVILSYMKKPKRFYRYALTCKEIYYYFVEENPECVKNTFFELKSPQKVKGTILSVYRLGTYSIGNKISDLEHFPNLEELRVVFSSCHDMELGNVIYAKKLKKLQLYSTMNITGKCFSNFPNVQKLVVDRCDRVLLDDSFVMLKNLVYLRIVDCFNWKKGSGLFKNFNLLKKLRKLKLDSIKNAYLKASLENLSNLSDFKLKYLILKRINSYLGKAYLSKTTVKNVENLRIVNFSSLFSIYEFEGIKSLTTSGFIGNCDENYHKNSKWDDFSCLERLKVGSVKTGISDFDFKHCLHNLKVLFLSGLTNFIGNGFIKMKFLEELYLDRCINFTDKGFRCLSNLRILTVKKNKEIKGTGIKECKKLRRLYLSNVKKVEEKYLIHLKKLETVFVNSCPLIIKGDILHQLPKLISFSLYTTK